MNELTKQIAQQVADMLTEQKEYITMLTEKAKEINNDEEGEGLNYCVPNHHGVITYNPHPIVAQIKDQIATYNKTLEIYLSLLRECKDYTSVQVSGPSGADVERMLKLR